jgi:5-methylthioadenosine/S-adenosylhomocysteine deaminase
LPRKARTEPTALFAKLAARDLTVFPAWEVLRLTTVEGARAVGMEDKTGSLEADKQAGLILVDRRLCR